MERKQLTPPEKAALLKACREIYEMTPYFRHIPYEITDADAGRINAAFRMEPYFCDGDDIVSPGILTAFCDTLMGYSCRTLGYGVTTLEINMNYVRPARAGERLRGTGSAVRAGNETVVTEAVITGEDGEVVVKGRASFYVLRKPNE